MRVSTISQGGTNAMTKNKVFLNLDDIVEITVVGSQTQESVTAMGDAARTYLQDLSSRGQPCLVLDDITQLGRTDIQARQAVSQLARTLPYKKAAILGTANVLMRYGTMLLLQAIGMGNKIKYFDTRDAAVAWLKKAS